MSNGKRPMQLLVSYVYYQSPDQDECEIRNKQTNLAVFLNNAVIPSEDNVRFVLTFPRDRPPASKISRILGVSSSSKRGKTITKALGNQLSNVKIVSGVQTPFVPDLCHHQDAIRQERARSPEFDYILILNDGTRGPFLRSAQVNNYVGTPDRFAQV